MNRTEYLAALERYLKRLPHEDFIEAMDYFTEYFDEVGPSGEADLIAELGSPKEAAHDILSQLLDKQLATSAHLNTKRVIRTAMLTLLAAPIALPTIATLIIFIFSIFIILGVTLLAGIVGLLVGASFIYDSFQFLTYATAAFLFNFGLGLASMGLGLLIALLVYTLGKWFLLGLIGLSKKIMKRGKRHA